ncbi:MAG: hypothetical protein OXH52_11715 [Gammaproteobacteria bacterium]|nr:hypothetical protein [Gammaproteobacteria bacterium]
MAEQPYAYLVSDQTRKEVWDKAYSTEYAERYYQLLGSEFLRRHRLCQYLLIGLGGGAVVPAAFAMFSGLSDPWIGIALGIVGVLLAIVSITNLVGDYARKASVTTSVARTCGRAGREYRDLLNAIDLNRIEDREARTQLTRLATLVENETYSTEAFGIDVDNKDNNSMRAERETRAHMESLYAS